MGWCWRRDRTAAPPRRLELGRPRGTPTSTPSVPTSTRRPPARPRPRPAGPPPPTRQQFGVNVNRLFNDRTYTPRRSTSSSRALQATGATVARSDALWEATEPTAPVDGVHHYDWSFDDAIAAALAQHGLRWLPIIDYTAPWAQSVPGDDHSPPSSAADYAAYAGRSPRATGVAARSGARTRSCPPTRSPPGRSGTSPTTRRSGSRNPTPPATRRCTRPRATRSSVRADRAGGRRRPHQPGRVHAGDADGGARSARTHRRNRDPSVRRRPGGRAVQRRKARR